jgi:sporulation protein YlmC with PRC-barrel domain
MALALSNVLKSACSLQLKRVVTRRGAVIGRVFDLQCRRHADGSGFEILALVYGKRGVLERLGVRARYDTIPWGNVVEITDDAVVIADADRN